MWSKTLGTLLGLVTVFLLLAGGYYLLVMPLVASPPRPEYENEFPITGPPPSPKPTPVAASPTPAPPSPTPSPEPQTQTGLVLEPLRVRVGPSREAETLSGVDTDETVTILETSGDGEFYRVKTQAGEEGWVVANGVRINTESRPSPSPGVHDAAVQPDQ